MARTSNLNIRIDPEMKKKAESIYSQFGITLTDAVNIFIYQSVNCNGLPFELKIDKIPNKETLEAMEESQKIIDSGISKFNTADEMFDDLGI